MSCLVRGCKEGGAHIAGAFQEGQRRDWDRLTELWLCVRHWNEWMDEQDESAHDLWQWLQVRLIRGETP